MRPLPQYEDIVERFEKFVMPEPMSGCHLWTGAQFKDGYGAFSFYGKPTSAHVVAFIMYYGERPEQCCHRCDNSGCVNPQHLYSGNHESNTQDRVARKRTAKLFGEDHAGSKLTWDQARDIRVRLQTRRVTVKYLAKQYGVSETTIRKIRDNEAYVHMSKTFR